MPLRKTLNAALLQLPALSRYQENLDTLLGYIEENPDADLIIAPEVALSGFDYAHIKTAAAFSRAALKRLKKAVGEGQMLVLTMIVEEKGAYYNRAFVIRGHKVIHKQDKAKLFALGDEDLYFKAGKSKKIKPFEVDGVRFAILICFELRFKELWKQIEGADVVLIPARWGKARKAHLEILSRALAVMNQCYVLVADAADADMARSSAVISPNGDVLQDDEKALIHGAPDLREVIKMRRYIRLF